MDIEPPPLNSVRVVPQPQEELEFDTEIDNEFEDPPTIWKAIHKKDTYKLMGAMIEEIKSLKKNQIWDLVHLPKKKKAIGLQWVKMANEHVYPI